MLQGRLLWFFGGRCLEQRWSAGAGGVGRWHGCTSHLDHTSKHQTTHVHLSSLCKFAKNVCAGRVEWKDVCYGLSWLEPDVVAAPEEPRTKPRAASRMEEDSVKAASLRARERENAVPACRV
jgi:hypothetical protein